MVKFRMGAKEVVAYNINRLIEERGVTQADVARAIDKEVQTVHLYTKAKRFPKPENMDAICDFFKVPLTELFKDKDSSISPERALEALAVNMGYEISKKN